jgi:hypothetical protein
MTAGEKQDAFDKCLKKSDLFGSVGAASASTLIGSIQLYRSRIRSALRLTNIPLLRSSQAIQDDPAGTKEERRPEMELLKLVKAAFGNLFTTPPW